MKRMLAILLLVVFAVGTAAAEGFVYSNTSVTDSANTQNMFTAFYESGHFVLPTPGLKEGVIPQGISYLPEEDWVIFAGYRDDGGSSAIIASSSRISNARSVSCSFACAMASAGSARSHLLMKNR